MGLQRVGHDWVTELQQQWQEVTFKPATLGRFEACVLVLRAASGAGKMETGASDIIRIWREKKAFTSGN